MSNVRWLELCAKAAQEHDPQKLAELVKEIATLLERKHQREASSKNSITEERA